MAFIGTFSRALLESATAVYFGGVSVSILNAQGDVILGDNLPDAPTITSTIADRTYIVGDSPVTVDLRTKFDGATSYTVSPVNAAVTISDYTLTITPTAALSATTFTVRGINGGGSSDPLTFALTVNAPAPILLKPFPDQSLLIGGGSVTLSLAEYFSGAVGYAVSPSGQGVAISNGNLVISRTTARDVVITVTATNATGQDTSDSFALLIAAPANQAPVLTGPIPAQTPTANVSFSSDLSSYFVDPDGDNLSYTYTGTLPTGIIRTGPTFSGTATVSGQTATGVLRARDPGNLEAEATIDWSVSAQPVLTATPPALTAGQQASITFNTLPDTVTVTQGGTILPSQRVGSTNEYTFTPTSGQTVSITATKDGWAAYSAPSLPVDATWLATPAQGGLTINAMPTVQRLTGTGGTGSISVTGTTTGGGTAPNLAGQRVLLMTDTDWTGDDIIYATRQTLPFLVAGLEDGDYTIANTDANPVAITVAAVSPTVPAAVFSTAPSGTLLVDFPDAEVWTNTHTTTGTQPSINSAGRLQPGTANGPVFIRGAANRGTRQYVEARVRLAGSNGGLILGLRVQGNSGYFLMVDMTNGFRIRRYTDGANVTISPIEPIPGGLTTGSEVVLRFEVDGTQLRYAIDGTFRAAVTDANFSGGGVGGRSVSTGANGAQNEWINFNGGSF